MLHRKQDGTWWRQINDPPYWEPLGRAETPTRWYRVIVSEPDEHDDATRTVLGASTERAAAAVASQLGMESVDWIGRRPFNEHIWLLYREQSDGSLLAMESLIIVPETVS